MAVTAHFLSRGQAAIPHEHRQVRRWSTARQPDEAEATSSRTAGRTAAFSPGIALKQATLSTESSLRPAAHQRNSSAERRLELPLLDTQEVGVASPARVPCP